MIWRDRSPPLPSFPPTSHVDHIPRAVQGVGDGVVCAVAPLPDLILEAPDWCGMGGCICVMCGVCTDLMLKVDMCAMCDMSGVRVVCMRVGAYAMRACVRTMRASRKVS